MPSGILPSARLAGVSNQDSGRYSRHANGQLASHVLQCRLTATWQLAILPKAPQDWRATPTDASPALWGRTSHQSATLRAQPANPPPSGPAAVGFLPPPTDFAQQIAVRRSEEHTSEFQSLRHLVCRLLL